MSSDPLSAAREFERLRRQDPIAIFGEWFEQAKTTETVHANAATLSTLGDDGAPQSRTVLMKSFGEDGFCFFTHKNSRKGKCLSHRPVAALLFYWKTQMRQASFEGTVRELSRDKVRAYYDTRPRLSKVGAWASRQSQAMDSFACLMKKAADTEARFAGQEPPLPPHWTGFCLSPSRAEFWREGEHRLHHRLVFTRQTLLSAWRAELLQP